MSAALSAAREGFIQFMKRDTTLEERTRLLAVLDAMIAWSNASRAHIRFRDDANRKGAVRFEHVASGAVFWAAIPRRQQAPLLQIPGAARILSEEERATIIGTLGAHTRETLDPRGHLQISFGALKNAAACAAVLELMGELLRKSDAENRSLAQAS